MLSYKYMQVILNSVAKRYNEKNVLTDINLEIDDGDFCVLKGRSGAGKTTLLNIICGLEEYDSGEVIIDGQNLNNMSKRQRNEFYNKKIGIVHQGFYLQPQLSVYDNISLPGYIAGMCKKDIDNRVREVSGRLDIADICNKKVYEISGGQQQRVVSPAVFP